MRKRDLELIAALVEGRLDDETEVRALIERSSEARTEYEKQHRAHDVLTNLGQATMTESERSALHRDVWGALRAQPAEQAASVPWYAGWISVTAVGLVALVVATVGVLGSGGDSDGVTEAASDGGERSVTTAAAATATTTGDDTAGGGDMTPLHAPTTAAAAAEEALSPEGVQFFSAEAARIRETETSPDSDSTTQSETAACLRDAELEDHIVVDVLDADEAGLSGTDRVLAAVPQGVAVGEATVTFVDADTCTIVFVDE